MAKHPKLPAPPKLTIGKFGYLMVKGKLKRAIVLGVLWHDGCYQVKLPRPYGWTSARFVYRRRADLALSQLMR